MTDEEIANLTPEQITELEEKENSEATENQEAEAETGDEPEQEEEVIAANGEGETEETEEEPVVLTKSGKGTIPYEKYKGLRVENATLREQVETLQRGQTELAKLREQHAKAGTPAKRAAIQESLNQQIKAMTEDFPDIGKSFSSMNEYLTDLEEELRTERAANAEKLAENEAVRQRSIDEQVQDAKENNPDLVHWEGNDPDAWQEALQQDSILRNSPKWANRPYDERFDEVVKRVRAVMPDATEPPSAAPSAKTQDKAQAALAKAKVRKLTTLSDIPSGADPGHEKDVIENLRPLELVKRLRGMSAQAGAAMRADLD